MRNVLAFTLVLLVAISCGSPTSPDLPAGAVRINGTVQRFTLEGGFWAIRGDDGVTYDPMNGLPAGFQRENLAVTVVGKVRTDMASIHMVGPILEILEIEEKK